MVYNLTANISQYPDTVGLLYLTDYLADGWFKILILVGFFSILFISLKTNYDTKRALAGAIFPTTFIAFLFKMMNFMPDYLVFVCMVGCVGAAVMLIWDK